MHPLKAAFNSERLNRFREPGILFGGGLLAGLLLFFGWLAFSSSSDVDPQSTEPQDPTGAMQKLHAGGAGVLGGISGGASSGQARSVSAAPDETTAADGTTAAAGENPGTAGDGSTAAPASAASEGEAITSGLLGPDESQAPEPAAAPGPEQETPVSEPAKDR